MACTWHAPHAAAAPIRMLESIIWGYMREPFLAMFLGGGRVVYTRGTAPTGRDPRAGAIPPYGYSEVPAPRRDRGRPALSFQADPRRESGTVDRHPRGPKSPGFACSRGRRSDGRAPGTGPGALFAFKIWAIRVVLQFTLPIALRRVRLRRGTRGIHRCGLYKVVLCHGHRPWAYRPPRRCEA